MLFLSSVIVKEKQMSTAIVYLIPTIIEDDRYECLPSYIVNAVKECQVFFVENERTARRFLKKIWPEMIIDNYEWHAIHKAEEAVTKQFRETLKQGKSIGILSEAGCPGVADPGQILIAAAQREEVIVKPLVGPSSILLALMASGMNGQLFRFNGYLPIEDSQRAKTLKALETETQKTDCTQIFIETPYRNGQMFEAILKHCLPQTRVCIAVSLTGAEEKIITRSVSEWRKSAKPDIHKKPVVFLLGS